jgi:hypothetical protein
LNYSDSGISFADAPHRTVKDDGIFSNSNVTEATFNQTLASSFFSFDQPTLDSVAAVYSVDAISKALQLPPPPAGGSSSSSDTVTFFRLFLATADAYFRCPARRALRAVSRSHRSAYAYRFDVPDDSDAARMLSSLDFVPHSSEVNCELFIRVSTCMIYLASYQNFYLFPEGSSGVMLAYFPAFHCYA